MEIVETECSKVNCSVLQDVCTVGKCTCANNIRQEDYGPCCSHDSSHVYTTHITYSASMLNGDQTKAESDGPHFGMRIWHA